jgi:histidine triad (HIT) family protein
LSDKCTFCEIVKGNLPSTKVYEDDQVLAFLDINPVAENHTLIIPKKHYVNLFDITEKALKHLIVATKRITSMYQSDYSIEAVNLLNASGVEAQQSVFHFHFHLVPRSKEDGLNLFLLPKK